jgi:type I restriction enzyme, R subunit
MTPPTGYTEDALVERPSIALLAELSRETVNAFHEFDHVASTLGRETRAEAILTTRLRKSLQRLNPGSPHEAIGQAIEDIGTRSLTHEHDGGRPPSPGNRLHR